MLRRLQRNADYCTARLRSHLQHFHLSSYFQSFTARLRSDLHHFHLWWARSDLLTLISNWLTTWARVTNSHPIVIAPDSNSLQCRGRSPTAHAFTSSAARRTASPCDSPGRGAAGAGPLCPGCALSLLVGRPRQMPCGPRVDVVAAVVSMGCVSSRGPRLDIPLLPCSGEQVTVCSPAQGRVRAASVSGPRAGTAVVSTGAAATATHKA